MKDLIGLLMAAASVRLIDLTFASMPNKKVFNGISFYILGKFQSLLDIKGGTVRYSILSLGVNYFVRNII
ncbi:MAG: hypothetical protein ACRD5J_19780 [Nitrososphaeraceae archaeon]